MTDKKLSQKNWSSWHHKLHKEILTKKILIPKGSNILISVSGGQDSMALLTLINDLKKLHNWSISVWHGDHQWHEKSSLYALELKDYCANKIFHSLLIKQIKKVFLQKKKHENGDIKNYVKKQKLY